MSSLPKSPHLKDLHSHVFYTEAADSARGASKDKNDEDKQTEERRHHISHLYKEIAHHEKLSPEVVGYCTRQEILNEKFEKEAKEKEEREKEKEKKKKQKKAKVATTSHGGVAEDEDEALPGILKNVDIVEGDQWIRWLDAVGKPEKDDYVPSQYPKNLWGAIWTTACRLAVLGLIAWYAAQLFLFQQEILQGKQVEYNYQGGPQTGQQIDVPTLQFTLQSSILFYESVSSPLQRIDVQDMTGYNSNIQSSKSVVPVATSFYSSQNVDLNSFDSNLQIVDPVNDVVQLNLLDQVFDIETHPTTSGPTASGETLKLLYEQAAVYPKANSWYNHTVYAFVRIPVEQANSLKMCQLQVSMYNRAVYDGLLNSYIITDGDYQSAELFPGLVHNDWSWSPASFDTEKGGKLPPSFQIQHPEQKLIFLSSRMTDTMAKAFATSTSYGPEGIDMTPYFNVSQFNLQPKSSNIGTVASLSDFINWEIQFSYVNNFEYTFTNVSCDGNVMDFVLALHEVNNTIDASATTITIDGLPNFSFDLDLPFQIMVSGAVGREIMNVTDIVKGTPTTLYVQRSNPIDFIWPYAEPFSLLPSSFPPTAADAPGWRGDPALYWDDGDCDCGLGALDPDCVLQKDPVIKNCAENEVCSAIGTCTNLFVANSEIMYISDNCYSVQLSGAVLSGAGFVGSDSEFASFDVPHAHSSSVCAACPGDPYYDGVPQTDSDTGIAVCNVSPGGGIFGTQNYNLNPKTDPGKPGSAIYNVLIDLVPFPTQGYPYFVTVSDGDGIEETLKVKEAFPPVNGLQLLNVSTASDKQPKYQHYSFAKLVSSLTATSSSIIVTPHPLDLSDASHIFPRKGPYSIRSADQEIKVTSAGSADFQPYQQLNLAGPPSEYLGYASYLQVGVTGSVQLLQVAPFEFYWDSVSTDRTYNITFPMILRNSFGDIEIFEYSQWSTPTWLTSTAYFHADDGCDCSVGLYDPDCAYPTPYQYANNGGISYNSNSSYDCQNGLCDCQVCVYTAPYTNGNPNPYPIGVCSSDVADIAGLPNANTWDPTNGEYDVTFFIMNITLNKETRLQYPAGSLVETSVPVSDDPRSNYYNLATDFYDIYTVSRIVMDRTDDVFPPSDRNLAHDPEPFQSPAYLTAEVAMFLIPDRPAFNQSTYCPSISTANSIKPVFEQNGWNTWTVNPSRVMSVSGCQGTPLSSANCVPVASQTSDQDFNRYCINEMPPNYEYTFNVTMPMNNKWVYQPQTYLQNAVNLPEFYFDFQVVYYFGLDASFYQTENDFSTEQPAGGDLLRDGTSRLFYGQLEEGVGGNMLYSDIAATLPYVNTQLTVNPADLSLSATDIYNLKPSNWPRDSSSIISLIQSFPNLTITWDVDTVGGSTTLQQVPLLPGSSYFFEAELSIIPLYNTDILSNNIILSWTLEATSLSVSQLPLDSFHDNECILRYKLSLRDTTYQLQQQYSYTISMFVANVGGVMSYLGAAVTLVVATHMLTKWGDRHDEYKKAQDERNKQKQKREMVAIMMEFMEKQGMIPGQGGAAVTNGDMVKPVTTTDMAPIEKDEGMGSKKIRVQPRMSEERKLSVNIERGAE